MDVYWLEQTEADVPAEDDWFSASEATCLNRMRFAKRRADWRLGRWTAKRALAAYFNVPVYPQVLAQIEIRPAPSGAPEVFFANKPAAAVVSLSHSAGTAVCALGMSGAELGCDLEVIEPRSDSFVADYFTAEEQALVARTFEKDRPRLCTLLWSGKESVLKALRVGLRLDTRCVIVNPGDALRRPAEGGQGWIPDPTFTVESSCEGNSWHPLHACYTDGQLFHGWWNNTDHLLRTMVSNPPPAPPILLGTPFGSSMLRVSLPT
jgi:4'-phosphopantetheinyl transferase